MDRAGDITAIQADIGARLDALDALIRADFDAEDLEEGLLHVIFVRQVLDHVIPQLPDLHLHDLAIESRVAIEHGVGRDHYKKLYSLPEQNPALRIAQMAAFGLQINGQGVQIEELD